MLNKIAIIWKDNKIIGYCHTVFEADDICKKYSNYSWSLIENNKKNKKNLNLLTINN